MIQCVPVKEADATDRTACAYPLGTLVIVKYIARGQARAGREGNMDLVHVQPDQVGDLCAQLRDLGS